MLYDVNGDILTALKGKKLSILGDSISTFKDWIPSENTTFYTGSNCGVLSVNDTWWHKLFTATGMTLELNNSWSGSRVTTEGSYTTRAGVTRAENLGTAPDVIIVYLGINDFNNEVDLGTYDGTQTFPSATNTFREAYAIMLKKILVKYYWADVWVCTLPSDERNGDVGFPEINGDDIKLQTWNQAIRDMAGLFGVKVLENERCGLTYFNLATYMGDYDGETGQALHPNALGHSMIANNAIRQICPSCMVRYPVVSNT